MPAIRVSVAVARLIGALVVGVVAGLIVGGVAAPAAGATFVVADGTAIDGRVVQATRNTLTLRVAIGGLRQLAIGQVREVRLTGADGRVIAGRLRHCAGGRCALEVGDELVWFEDDRVVERVPVGIAAAARTSPAAAAPPPVQPIAAAATRPPATAAPSAAVPVAAVPMAAVVVPAAAPATARPDRSAAAGSPTAVLTMAIPPRSPPTAAALPLTELPRPAVGADVQGQGPNRPAPTARLRPTEDAAPVALVTVVRPAIAAPTPDASGRPAVVATARGNAAAPPVVTVTARPAGPTEASGEIVFAVELSRPLDEAVVVIYATVDAGAEAGVDYDARQGILTLPAGTTAGEIRTVLHDDAEPEGDEGFQLFLAADPEVTTIAAPWTKVTIQDDD